ncbi:dash complex subunit ask1 [Malassezia pachydermatis]|uniref:DASH complex subunit ASK1 n=1 Tax=Malassezia pachydermatis TaxID=77020 RepID=A0A0M8MLP2_9BASI|nr:dash complex subunit ask1 [Malassezia pachydermatis]KOS14078.1 dash complex subunit ask1 [Malassezia pachydermatis]
MSENVAVGEQLMQLDQAITATLQEIDENFSQAHQIVTSRILPAIREYEASCSQTWQAARFWKQFFEASAQVSLSQQPLEELEETLHEPMDPSESLHPPTTYAMEPEDSVHATRDSDQIQSPPRLSTSIYAGRTESNVLETPFERLKRDVEASRMDDSAWRDAPLPTGDMSVANDPSVALSDIPRSSSPVKNRRRSSARPRVSVVAGQDGLPANPFMTGDATKAWNGIADLRTTPLRSHHHVASHREGQEEEQDDEGDEDTSLALPPSISPPVTMQFSVPQSKYLKTPAKEAARRVVHDLLRSVGGDEDDLSAASPSMTAPTSGSARRKSVVGTPLVKRGPQHRRDSLPTPPTITKVYHAPPEEEATSSHSRAGLQLDEDEDGPVRPDDASSPLPSMFDSLLQVNDHHDAKLQEATLPSLDPTQISGQQSRSIEDDTLFGLGPRRGPDGVKDQVVGRTLSSAVRRSSDELRLLGEMP